MQKNSKYSIQILHPKNGKRNSWLLKCGLCIVTSFQRKQSRKKRSNVMVEKPYSGETYQNHPHPGDQD